ncbi:hypothetical protein Pan216_07030 [Planctomycetes bacterium Pan216]|uniref:Hemerythrin-like domain-containing protein n=1 Tax=Kolteria novifilia TaxID=2527975 RepID=A0A518AYV5_9BACT|nr:hypothetical protein Pan216_07030 [Planctomycetes bacterium Pan216]
MEDSTSIGKRIKIENEILFYVREALSVAIRAPLAHETAIEWLERAQFLVGSFSRHVRRLFAIEEEGGYMDFVTALKPTFANRAAKLREEHRSLVSDLEGIRADAHNTNPSNLANLHSLQQRLLGFFRRLESHRHHEWELLQETYLVDLGGEG